MSKKRNNLIAKIMENPVRSDITFNEMDLFLRSQGFEQKRNTGGSHILFTRSDLLRPITVYSNKGVVSRYIVNKFKNKFQ